MMRKLILLAALGAALLSCEKRPLFPTAPRRDMSSSRVHYPTLWKDTYIPPGLHVFATAVVFPDTVAWRKGESDGGRILLLRDGEPVGGIPVGAAASADRHCFRDGHLWTYVPKNQKTVISRDGLPFITYPGEEMIRGFLVEGDEVHTLGQQPGGGFTYRIRGQLVFSSPSGLVLGSGSDPHWRDGALTRDGDAIYYTYGITHASAEEEIWEYRVMCGGELFRQLSLPAEGVLYDVRPFDGRLCQLEQRYGRFYLVVGKELTELPIGADEKNLCWVVADGRLMVKGYNQPLRRPNYWLMETEGNFTRHGFESPYSTQLDVFLSGGVVEVVVGDDLGYVAAIVQGGRYTFPRTGFYEFSVPRCAASGEGVFAVALTCARGNEQLLVVNGNTKKVSFNGYFTGVYIEYAD